MSSHRRAALAGALLAAASPLFGLLGGAPALAATTTDPAKVGMYGAPDRPFLEYDAVFVHSLAMLGLAASGGSPAPEAVAWLVAQQCPDGGFTAFRTPVDAACPATDLAAFTGEDSNSTALAAMALRAAGRTAESARAEAWLAGLRDAAGGWPYLLGSGADSNSTGLVLLALAAAGLPAPSGIDAYARSARVDCAGSPADQGGITTPFSGGAPDALATVQAVPGFAGAALPLDPPSAWAADAPALSCPESTAPTAAQVAGHGAAWLEAQQAAGALTGANAAWAVLALGSVAGGRPEAEALYADLRADALASANPGLVGLGALDAHVLGHDADATAFRAAIAALLTTAPVPAATPPPTATSTPTPSLSAPARATDSSAPLPATIPSTGPPPAVVDMAVVAAGLLALGALLAYLGRRRPHAGPDPAPAEEPRQP